MKLKQVFAALAAMVVSGPAWADWSDSLISLGLDGAGSVGTVECPAGGATGAIWGTGTYTSDSSICTAAVHYGWITVDRGGMVSFRQTPGLDAYQGSEQNGISSFDYGLWQSSFQITGAEALASSAPAVPTGVQPIGWSDHPDGLGIATRVTESFGFMCPPSGGASATIWGTDVYTSDSPICVAAQHRGLISANSGGPVTILILGPQPIYPGSSRGGVQSVEYPSWDRSYIVQ